MVLNYHSTDTARILAERAVAAEWQLGEQAMAIGRLQRQCEDASALASSARSGTAT
jgi:hypothetical protein